MIRGEDLNGATTWIAGNSSGSVYQGDNAGTWSTTSDIAIKRNIGDFSKGLSELRALKVRSFQYKVGNPKNLDPEPMRQGVIAQELEKVFPESVKRGEDGLKSVNTDAVFWAMVNAVQELSDEVEELKQKLNERN